MMNCILLPYLSSFLSCGKLLTLPPIFLGLFYHVSVFEEYRSVVLQSVPQPGFACSFPYDSVQVEHLVEDFGNTSVLCVIPITSH